jgi:hypothetical protein
MKPVLASTAAKPFDDGLDLRGEVGRYREWPKSAAKGAALPNLLSLNEIFYRRCCGSSM